MASTAQEALIAELLGDVGKLHDAIKELPKALAPVCGAVVKVTRDAQSAIDGFGAAQEMRLKGAVDKEREELRADLKVMIRQLATKQAESVRFLGLWKVLMLIAITAAGSAFFGYRIATATDARLMAYVEYGRAVSAAWDHLDDTARTEVRKQLDKEK